MTNSTTAFDRPTLDRLRTAYDKAVAAGQSQFEFDGHPLLVSYARYLIQYLESRLSH